jgi:hypothetical protein
MKRKVCTAGSDFVPRKIKDTFLDDVSSKAQDAFL